MASLSQPILLLFSSVLVLVFSNSLFIQIARPAAATASLFVLPAMQGKRPAGLTPYRLGPRCLLLLLLLLLLLQLLLLGLVQALHLSYQLVHDVRLGRRGRGRGSPTPSTTVAAHITLQ